MLGDDEPSVAILVQKVGTGQACGVDIARQPEEMVVWVLEVGGIGVEERADLVAGILAG